MKFKEIVMLPAALTLLFACTIIGSVIMISTAGPNWKGINWKQHDHE